MADDHSVVLRLDPRAMENPDLDVRWDTDNAGQMLLSDASSSFGSWPKPAANASATAGSCHSRLRCSLITSIRPTMLSFSCLHVPAFAAALAITACGSGSTSPTMPGGTGASDVVSLDLSCPASLLIGEKEPCVAVARMRNGQAPIVSFEAAWTSTRPDLVTVDTLGVVNGRSAGQGGISASYRGRNASASIMVTAEDALRVKAAAEQGEFRPGSTVTMWLQGYYSVASEETARLMLRITDQAGIVTTTTPLTVARGGDFFLLSTTFVVPQGSTRVCRTAVLEVGSVTVIEPQTDASPLRCIAIRPVSGGE